jgi:branched-chain amino acid transport system substrate-binding protein
MRARARLVCTCLTVVTVGVAGCGGKSSTGANSGRTTLTIYSSMPLQGPAEAQSESVIKAQKLALAEAGGRIGKFSIKGVYLDDSTAAANRAEPGQTSANARRAAQDASTIAYLGEGNDGASAVSIPLTNEAGILQVSPSDTPSGLTRRDGAAPGQPDSLYPSGERTFARVVPNDGVQAAAQVAYQLDEGCTKTFVLSNRGLFGRGLAAQFRSAAKSNSLEVVAASFPPGTKDFADVARRVRSSHADCMLFAGVTADEAVRAFAAIHQANPSAKLFGTSGVAESSFTEALPTSVQRVTYITSPTLDPQLYPPEGQKFFTTYRDKYGKDPEPAAIFGYEAMKLTLLAIQNAGDKGNDRHAVIDALFKIKDHDSPLGTYSIDGNGDTTLSDYAADRVENGKLVFEKVLNKDK